MKYQNLRYTKEAAERMTHGEGTQEFKDLARIVADLYERVDQLEKELAAKK